ncbi:complex I subunit 4 family protein [Dechloromonas denitrificans]|uniref:complex I subunit 4 family protein n=1 Tax=Dechloromonas denitrificans TaxID=281362 RepID=UPI001CFBDCEC|nr:NADH-quinone oxidoreductase subunit M [Dechloromonas denitrificans]UCV07333.1 NADH-quinone oxidoreductase subunit M [Dechloromonas denitrificans]
MSGFSEIFWAQQSGLPLLVLLQLLPLLGAALVFVFQERASAVVAGKVFALGELVLAIVATSRIDPLQPALQLAERFAPLAYHVAVDGLSLIFLLVTALLTLLLMLYGMSRGMISPGRLYAVLLIAEAGLVGMLLTLNVAWFAFYSALELWAVVYLLRRWASSRAEIHALSRFIQYQAFGWLLFAAGCLVLGWGHAEATGGRWSFDLFDLVGAVPVGKFQTAAFYLLFYGLAVRTPLFPLHGWLPNMAQHGLIAVAPALMVGVKVGIYGMLRFVLPLTPAAVQYWQPYIVGFAMAGIFFTAALAFQQTNLRRLLAFAVVSHTSLLVIGVFSLHESGIQGAVLLAANFGLAVTGMWFIVGFVFRRTGTTELHELSGLFERIPFLAIAFLIFGLAIVGMPGTPGFDAAHLVLEAAIDSFGALSTVAAALGNVAAAGFLLWAFQRAFLSPHKAGRGLDVDKTLPMEYLVCGIALAAMVAIGVFTEPWLRLSETASQAAAARFVR